MNTNTIVMGNICNVWSSASFLHKKPGASPLGGGPQKAPKKPIEDTT